MPALTNHQRKKRERDINRMIKEGMSQTQIARELGIAPQSVQKFLKLRNLETTPARLHREKIEKGKANG